MKFKTSIPNYILAQCDQQSLKQLYRITGVEKSVYFALGNGEETISIKKRSSEVHQIGDWIFCNQENCVTEKINVTNSLRRIKDGKEQIIANNADQLWIVTSANSDFSFNRLDRYIQMAKNSNIIPTIILTKIDLISQKDLEEITSKIQNNFKEVYLIAISVENQLNLKLLGQQIGSKETIVLMGSSGVGKSTLINYILRSDDITDSEIVTAPIRKDGKGRHTTTNRKMFLTRNGSYIVDNPGIRGISVQIDFSFDHLSCQFRNCTHNGEQGCQINELLESGDLTIDRLNNVKKMMNENEFFDSKNNFELRKKRQSIWKQRSIEIKNTKSHKNYG